MKPVLITFAFYLLLSVKAHAQECSSFTDSVLHKTVYRSAEEPPYPVRDIMDLLHHISNNFHITKNPQEYGRVLVAMVIEPDGKIDGQRVIRDPSGSEQLWGKQVLKLAAQMKWVPGKCNGKAVPVLYFIPFTVDPSLSDDQ